MIKTEFSLECSICGVYNIDEGVIINGEIICWGCIKKYPGENHNG